MLSISLSKKTFGIKNKTILIVAATFYISVSIAISVLSFCELFIVDLLLRYNMFPNAGKLREKKPSVSFAMAVFQCYGSIFIRSIIGLYILDIDERFTKKQSFRIGCATVFHILFLFNPLIANCQKEDEEFYIILHYTVTLHYSHFYCCLAMAAFICWLPWQNQSKKPKYKVIYGGEDSVTKKLLDDYSV